MLGRQQSGDVIEGIRLGKEVSPRRKRGLVYPPEPRSHHDTNIGMQLASPVRKLDTIDLPRHVHVSKKRCDALARLQLEHRFIRVGELDNVKSGAFQLGDYVQADHGFVLDDQNYRWSLSRLTGAHRPIRNVGGNGFPASSALSFTGQ